jgi:hypothetical protein
MNLLKRLAKLEEIATSFKGVEKCFAIQAGREIRVVVESEQISDQAAYVMARDIAKRIEDEMEYPGQIKVTVIRETRAVDTPVNPDVHRRNRQLSERHDLKPVGGRVEPQPPAPAPVRCGSCSSVTCRTARAADGRPPPRRLVAEHGRGGPGPPRTPRGFGILPPSGRLFNLGIDLLTSGNHIWDRRVRGT